MSENLVVPPIRVRPDLTWRVGVLFAVATFVGVGPSPAGQLGSSLPANVVLITLDTTRADHVGAWGWPHARTPNLDALAAAGTRFARCDTAAPITLPSHASIFTGLYPPRHGVRDNGTFVLAGEATTLAEALAEAGYDTGAVIAAAVLARHHGLDQGFRIYDDDLGSGYSAGTQVGERDAAATTDAALAVLGRLRSPYFLWIHYFDPHEELKPPSRFADLGGPHRLYDGEIAYVDEQIGRLLAAVGWSGASRSSSVGSAPGGLVVAVVGDHGEMLGDHGEATHGLLPFAGARRVPLLLAGPRVPVGLVDTCLRRTVDLFPTLLGLAGRIAPTAIDGRSLLPVDANCEETSYIESYLPFFAYRWYPLRALSDGNLLAVHGPRPALHLLAADGREGVDLAPAATDKVAVWRQRLTDLLAASGESLEPLMRAENALSAEQRAKLESLGYVGGAGGGQVTTSLPDPRDMTEIATRIQALHLEVQQGRCAEVLRELQQIVRRDPQNFPALNLAGFCLCEVGRSVDAIPLFEQAIAVNELSAVPVANLAGALRDLGRRDAAMREYRRALTLDPTQAESASNLARLLRDGGAVAEALAVLDAAIVAGARAPAVLLERGTIRAEAGNLDGALADFRDAARRNPADPVPLENAAHAAFALGQAKVAVQLYEQLLRLVPSRGDLWKTVGAIHLEALGDPKSAVTAFRRALALEVDPAERRLLEITIRELER